MCFVTQVNSEGMGLNSGGGGGGLYLRALDLDAKNFASGTHF